MRTHLFLSPVNLHIRYEKPYVTSTTSTSYTKTETTTKTETSTTISTTTSTSTTTETTTATVSYCPPPPPCTGQVYNPWTTFTMTKSGTKVNPYTITVNPTNSAWFWLSDIDFKSESYAITIDGQPLGNTGAFVADKTYQTNPDTAISSGWSWGKFPITAGPHTIVVNGINFDTGYTTYRASWKLVEKCE
ncbi:hypothetical protein DL93DRAFT_2085491 [Clavulina sp. PMI_390]|nr:hypothetical protein DL93DRAFT_2085491 [Clavulina sp. PMI_390]